MFRLFSKLFSKNASTEPEETAPNGAPAEVTPKFSFKEFAAKMIAKVRFWFYLVLCLALLGTLGFYFYSYVAKTTRTSIESAQAVMVNVITDEVFIGALYKDPNDPKEQPTNSPTDEEMKANAAPNAESAPAKTDAVEPTPVDSQKYRAKPLCGEAAKKAKVALIITGLGLSKNQTLEALGSDTNITLGFSPYASDVGGWVSQAVDKGFEVMLQLPMQPSDYQINDPGLYAMLQNLSAAENLDRLNSLIARSNKIIGFYSQPNEVFSSSKDDITPIIERLSKDKFLFLYGNTQNQSDMQTICNQNALECLYVDHSINDELNEKKIFKALQTLEADAVKTGYSIGYLNGYPVTLKALKRWLAGVDGNKVALTPLSAVLEYTLIDKATDADQKNK